MNKIVQPQWLEWAKELQFIAQGGLTYSKDVFDIERFERIREIAAEMLSLQSEIPIEKVKNLFCNETGFQTPKLDTRAAIFKDDKILLVKEKNGTWSLPGGWGVHRHRDPERAGGRGADSGVAQSGAGGHGL